MTSNSPNVIREALVTLRARFYTQLLVSALLIAGYVLLFSFNWMVGLGVYLILWAGAARL